MSLINLKPRPIESRDKDPNRLRDARLFIVACDDTYAPKQYFDFFRLTRVQIHVVPASPGDSAAASVLERLLEYECEEIDERWMLLDTDHFTQGTHLTSFLKVLRDARGKGVNVALSKPCFEIWLLLHYLEGKQVCDLTDASAVESALRTALGEYNKTNLKVEHYPRSSVPLACKRAEALDQIVNGGEIPDSNTTRVYQLLKAIVSKALPSQLPDELRCLLESNLLNTLSDTDNG